MNAQVPLIVTAKSQQHPAHVGKKNELFMIKSRITPKNKYQAHSEGLDHRTDILRQAHWLKISFTRLKDKILHQRKLWRTHWLKDLRTNTHLPKQAKETKESTHTSFAKTSYGGLTDRTYKHISFAKAIWRAKDLRTNTHQSPKQAMEGSLTERSIHTNTHHLPKQAMQYLHNYTNII